MFHTGRSKTLSLGPSSLSTLAPGQVILADVCGVISKYTGTVRTLHLQQHAQFPQAASEVCRDSEKPSYWLKTTPQADHML